MMDELCIYVNRGSDTNLTLTWSDSSGDPYDLRDCSVSLFEPHQALIEKSTVDISDPEAGKVYVSIPWNDEFPSGKVVNFRIQIRMPGDIRMSTRKIWMVIQ